MTSFGLTLSSERDPIPITSFAFFDALLTLLLVDKPNTFGRNLVIHASIALKKRKVENIGKERRGRVLTIFSFSEDDGGGRRLTG
jgi:hypothetical protein